MTRRRQLLAIAAVAPFAASLPSARASQPGDAAAMRQAATALLRAAEGGQGQRLHAEFASPRRTRWHYVPGTRDGLALAQVSKPLADRVQDLLRVSLSAAGLEKVQGVLELAKLPGSERGAGSHALMVFGEPAATGAWGWRLDGHHLSLNFTILDDRIVSTTPLFVGADPNPVLAPLFRERYMGRDLARSLTPAQLARARGAGGLPSDVLAGPGRAAIIRDAEGVSFRELGEETQRHLMLGLAESYLGTLASPHARARLAQLTGPARDELRFAWRGGLEESDRCYYRLHGETLWIEYATRMQADHVHTLWREPGNDFGRAALSATGLAGAIPPQA